MPRRRGTLHVKCAAFAFLSPKTANPGCLMDKALPCLSHMVLIHSTGCETWLNPGASPVLGK